MTTYTAGDIEQLREACKKLYLCGTTQTVDGWSVASPEGNQEVGVEQMIQTYVAAGLKANDIYLHDYEKRNAK